MRAIQDFTPVGRERLLALAKRAKVKERSTESSPLVRIERDQTLGLSLAQQGVWLLAKSKQASRAYHIAGGLRLRGQLDRGALRRARDRIVARHEILRTIFGEIDGSPKQI